MLDLGNRVLLNDGISLVDDDEALKYLLETGELPQHIMVMPSADSAMYKTRYKDDLSHPLADSKIIPDISFDDKEYLDICEELYNTRRGEYNEEQHTKRFIKELDYFERGRHQHLIVKLYHLINRFREDGIVWGVGRGSASASYIFYLMGVHDVDVLKYSLHFSEFSKEKEEYGNT